MKQAQALLSLLWQDYTSLNPRTLEIYDLLSSKGHVQNDHIALRTYNHPKVNVDALSQYFTNLGYVPMERYQFTQKQLNAQHFEHPDTTLPKVFISELRLESFSRALQNTVNQFIDQITETDLKRWDFPVIGRPWSLTSQTYQALLEESEYAGWVSALGFRANHFTVLVNAHPGFADLKTLNDFLLASGYQMNQSGGLIKGSPDVYLEQSSTMASKIDIPFSDRVLPVPGCYYEFAQRYPLQDGSLFNGFVTGSADKIFESTDTQS